MTNIYDKLEIPPASSDLESRIIAATATPNRKQLFQRFAMVAACLMIIISVLHTPDQQPLVTKKNMLTDVEFFDDQYGFAADIS